MGKYADMYKVAKEAGVTKEVSPTYHEFKKGGDVILGRFLGKAGVKSAFGTDEYNQYLFETDDGLIKCALGAATDKEAGLLLTVGAVYRIEFKGKEKITGGRQVNKFKITLVDLDEFVPDREPGEEG